MAITNVEFIRYLIDFIDSEKGREVNSDAPLITVNVDAAGQQKPDEVDTALDRDDVFVPPLQAKLEIMKKMAGIEPKNQDLIASDDDEPLDV